MAKIRTYGFIGCGNMGGALARALVQRVDPAQVMLANRTQAKAEALAAELGAQAASVAEVAARADAVIIGVKPQNLNALFDEIRPVLAARPWPNCRSKDICDEADTCPDRLILVSMCAGVSIARICELAGEDVAVVRIMPNLPAAVGEGTTLYCSHGIGPGTLKRLVESFAAAGTFVAVPEEQFDAGMAISGCGPAFAFMFADALAKGGVAAGLDYDQALTLALETMRGSAALVAAESGRIRWYMA